MDHKKYKETLETIQTIVSLILTFFPRIPILVCGSVLAHILVFYAVSLYSIYILNFLNYVLISFCLAILLIISVGMIIIYKKSNKRKSGVNHGIVYLMIVLIVLVLLCAIELLLNIIALMIF